MCISSIAIPISFKSLDKLIYITFYISVSVTIIFGTTLQPLNPLTLMSDCQTKFLLTISIQYQEDDNKEKYQFSYM